MKDQKLILSSKSSKGGGAVVAVKKSADGHEHQHADYDQRPGGAEEKFSGARRDMGMIADWWLGAWPFFRISLSGKIRDFRADLCD